MRYSPFLEMKYRVRRIGGVGRGSVRKVRQATTGRCECGLAANKIVRGVSP